MSMSGSVHSVLGLELTGFKFDDAAGLFDLEEEQVDVEVVTVDSPSLAFPAASERRL